MITIEQVVKNLIGLKITPGEFKIQISTAFNDYEFKGSSKIIVSESIRFISNFYNYIAYADFEDAPIVKIRVNENNIITNADIY